MFSLCVIFNSAEVLKNDAKSKHFLLITFRNKIFHKYFFASPLFQKWLKCYFHHH